MGRIKSALEREILNQRAHWFNWSPVILAFGIGAYFELPNEPNFSPYIWISIIAVCGFGFIVFPSIATRVLFGATLIFCLGFCAAAFRANHVSAPVLKYRYYGPIEGRVIAIDKSNEIHVSIVPQEIIGDCVIYREKDIDRTGAIAIWRGHNGEIKKLDVTLSRQKTRLWSPPRWKRINR